jgi:H+/gluconate symporter-like permease
LRPILMTTAAMVVAMVPLLVAGGAGGAARFDIGIVIFAGMIIGTLFTLFVTPVIYTYIARDHLKAKEVLEAEEAGGDLDAEAEAGVLFPGEAKTEAGKGRGSLPTAAE